MCGDTMIDTHAHLSVEPQKSKIKDILKEANKHNVSKIINIGMYKEANQDGIILSETYDVLYTTVGIHPSYVDEEILDVEELIRMSKHEKVVAIGEIGIDLYWTKDNLDKQKEYFIKQLEIAKICDLPVIIHSRNSADVILEILKTHKGVKGVMHCYSEHPELVEAFIDLGFYIGIGGVVTFKNASVVRDIAKKVPIDRLLIETDTPYLAPHPFRGKENSPDKVRFVLEKLSEIRNISITELDSITTENTYRLFRKIK